MFVACTSERAFCSDAGDVANHCQKQEWALAGFSGGGVPQHYTTNTYMTHCVGGEHGTKENTPARQHNYHANRCVFTLETSTKKAKNVVH